MGSAGKALFVGLACELFVSSRALFAHRLVDGVLARVMSGGEFDPRVN